MYMVKRWYSGIVQVAFMFIIFTIVLLVLTWVSALSKGDGFWLSLLGSKRVIKLEYEVTADSPIYIRVAKPFILGNRAYIAISIERYSESKNVSTVKLMIKDSHGKEVLSKEYTLLLGTLDLVNTSGYWVGKFVFLLPLKPLSFANHTWLLSLAFHRIVKGTLGAFLNESKAKHFYSMLISGAPPQCREELRNNLRLIRAGKGFAIMCERPILLCLVSDTPLQVSNWTALEEVLRRFSISRDRLICFSSTNISTSQKPLEKQIELARIFNGVVSKALNESPVLTAIAKHVVELKLPGGGVIVHGDVYGITSDCRVIRIIPAFPDLHLIYDMRTGVLLYLECGSETCRRFLQMLPLDVLMYFKEPAKHVEVRLVNATISFGSSGQRPVVQGGSLEVNTLALIVSAVLVAVLTITLWLRRR